MVNTIENTLKKMKHKVSHILGWNTGQIVSFWCDNILYIGFQCDHCKRINNAFPTKVKRNEPNFNDFRTNYN